MTAVPESGIADLPGLPRDEAGPVFREPWEAEAFAMAAVLVEAGAFTTADWSTVLGAEIERARAAGDPDRGDTYYRHWLAALERLCAAKGLVLPDEREDRKAAWRDAYLRTPHGRPVAL